MKKFNLSAKEKSVTYEQELDFNLLIRNDRLDKTLRIRLSSSSIVMHHSRRMRDSVRSESQSLYDDKSKEANDRTHHARDSRDHISNRQMRNLDDDYTRSHKSHRLIIDSRKE